MRHFVSSHCARHELADVRLTPAEFLFGFAYLK
jgi:hypothetical protein